MGLEKNLERNSKKGFDIDFSSLAHTYIRVIAIFFTASIAGFFFIIQQGIQNVETLPLDMWTISYFGGMILAFGISLGTFLYVRDPRMQKEPEKVVNIGVILIFVGIGFGSAYTVYTLGFVPQYAFLKDFLTYSFAIVLLAGLFLYFKFLGRIKI